MAVSYTYYPSVGMPEIPECSYLFKIILVGDSGVGKTALVNRICCDSYTDNTSTTIGVDMKLKDMIIGDKLVKLSVWDTAGQEKYAAITRQYWRRAHGVLFVFDITDKQTFDSLSNRWLPDYKTHCDQQGAVTIIVGNKADEVAERAVTTDDAVQFAQQHGCLYFETSAKTNAGVYDALLWGLVSTILDTPTLLVNDRDMIPDAVRIEVERVDPDKNKRHNGCC